MELGMVGLGRMGVNLGERLVRGGHTITFVDPNADARKAVEARGAVSVDSLQAWVKALPTPSDLLPLLSAGDTVIDGGNSNKKNGAARYAARSAGFAQNTSVSSGLKIKDLAALTPP